MSDNSKHVTVRLRVPPELRDKIAESSERYNRSMNADIVARLEASFAAEDKDEKKPAGFRVRLDDDWFDKTGLSEDEFAQYVRLAVLRDLTDDKESK